jgi:hypothetical protein
LRGIIKKKRDKEYYYSNREKILNQSKSYYKTANGRESQKRSSIKYKINYPDKVKSRKVVQNNIHKGVLQSPKNFICSICNQEQAQEYHHHNGYDPNHWLDVVPVCISCHRKVDK